MIIDKDTGRCKCDTTIAAQWADDWASFTISITSKSVKFRDLKAETANTSKNQQKTCRIGNEGSMFDSTSTTDVKSSFSSDRCGDATNTDTEVSNIVKQVKNMNYEDSSSSSKVQGGTSTNPNPSMSTSLTGPQFSQESTVSGGKVMTKDQQQSTSTTTPTQTAGQQQTVGKDATTCPNKKETLTKDEMSKLGMSSKTEGDAKKYIQSLGVLFGDLSDADINQYRSPLEGLVFTSKPENLCSLLFDADTLKYIFKNPTCTLTFDATKTYIKVTMGENAQIHKGFVAKIQPNVFVSGCDWPIMNALKITDGANPTSLNVKFDSNEQSAVVCQDVSFKLEPTGKVGDISCDLSIDSLKDASGNAITSGGAVTAKTEIQTSNSQSNSNAEFKIPQASLTTLKSNNVNEVTIKGKCTDSAGQEQFVSKKVTLTNGETDITMQNQPTKIAYDPSTAQKVRFSFDYKNCGSTTSKVTQTITLQKMTGANTWTDTTTATETITNGDTIPAGLDQTSKYRLKVTATNGSTKTSTTFVDLEFARKKPDIMTNNIKPYFKADSEFSYTFTDKDFRNVADFSKLKVSFTCVL